MFNGWISSRKKKLTTCSYTKHGKDGIDPSIHCSEAPILPMKQADKKRVMRKQFRQTHATMK